MTKGVSVHASVKRLLVFAFIFGFAAFASPRAQSQTFSVVHSFTSGTDGENPLAGLVMDASGNLYGTTSAGGDFGAGTVFEYSSTGVESVLYNFTGGADGGSPEGSFWICSSILLGQQLAGRSQSSGPFSYPV